MSPRGLARMLNSRRLVILAVCLGLAALFFPPWPGPLARWTRDLDAMFLSYAMFPPHAMPFSMRFRQPRPPPPEIVGVTIDDNSLNDPLLGRWPWPRGVHARLIDRLTKMGASVIAFDVFFQRPEPAEDAALAAAIRRSGRVVLAMGGDRENPRFPLPLFADAARNAVGHVFVEAEGGGMVYRIQLTPFGATVPFLPLCLLAVQRHRHLVESLPTFEERAIHMGNLAVPVDKGQLIVDFVGPSPSIYTVSYIDVLHGKVEPQVVTGKIVVVYSTFAIYDQFFTPIDRDNKMPGGEIHANAIHTMLAGSYIRRLEEVAFGAILVGLALLVVLAFSGSRFWQYAPLLVALAAAVLVAAFLAFRELHIWVPVARLVLYIPVAAIAVMIVERVRLRYLFASFIPEHEVDRLLASAGHLEEGTRKIVVTVLFADIRGYTTLSEQIDPQRMVEFLNEFHAVTDAAVRARGGEIFDYLGDASMVVFGAPRPHPDHARAAVEAALDIQHRLDERRGAWAERGYPAPQVGIGVCTGEVAYGLVGTGRRQYTVIGDTTNVAARIQGLSAQFDSPVLISESTFSAAGEWFETRPLPPVSLKGKTEPVQIYAVTARRGIDPAAG